MTGQWLLLPIIAIVPDGGIDERDFAGRLFQGDQGQTVV